LLWLIAHTEVFFPGLLVVLILLVEFGFWIRRESPETSAEIQSVIESARDGLGVLLGLLLGFSFPMSLPHYEQRTQLVTDEANAIATVEQRAQLLPDALRDQILRSLPEYVNSRHDFAGAELDGPATVAAINHARRLQEEMWQGTATLAQQNLNQVSPTVIQAVGQLSDLIEQRLAAAEKHIPAAIWMVFILISSLTAFVVGYAMRYRVWLAMLVLPLTVAIVLSLVSELDNPRAGLVRVSQQSMLRLQHDLKAQAIPGR
jgi:hypothetical protein